MDVHIQDLTKCQNVCYILSQQMQNKINQHDNATQLPNKYQVGDFVLLRKIKIQGPRHGIKLKRIFHEEPYRIIRRYKTNVMLVPYTKRFMKQRLKGEGKVTKNMAVLAKISRLKPIQNPLRMLNLTISEKLLKSFQQTSQIMDPPIESLEIIPPHTTREADQLMKDCNPSIHMDVPNQTYNGTVVHPLQLKIPQSIENMRDICAVDLRTIEPGHRESSFSCSSVYDNSYTDYYSDPSDKILPKKADLLHEISSSDDYSGSIVHTLSTEVSPPVKSDSVISYSAPEINPFEAPASPARDTHAKTSSGNGADLELLQTPERDSTQSEVVSSRARLSSKKRTRTAVTTINLPSGKSLRISYNPSSASIKDLRK